MGIQTNAAALYAEQSSWQQARGLDLMKAAAPAPGERVLDLGCGPGILTQELARRVGPTGEVIGIDPDEERLALAKLSKPKALSNLCFHAARGEQIVDFGRGYWDLVYSNYVAHWIENKRYLMQQVRRALRPGGRAAFELCGAFSPFMEELYEEGELSGQRLPAKVTCLSDLEWEILLEETGFVVEQSALLAVPYYFPTCEQFAAWWEGTTHGAIRLEALRPAYLAKLERYFNGGGTFNSISARFIAYRPEE